MTKIKPNKKLKVALFIDYGDNAELGMKKEIKLKEYCKKNNLEISHIYRTERITFGKPMNISMVMNDFENNKIDYSTIISYTINDFAKYDMTELILSLYILQELAELKIITLKEGIVGEDFLIDFTPSLNVKGKKELNILNNPYLDEEIEKSLK